MNRMRVTLIDLLIGVLLVPIVVVVCLAETMVADDAQNRIKCASNLRILGQAMRLYADENKGAYPRTIYAPVEADKPTWGTPYRHNDKLTSHDQLDLFAADDSPVAAYRPAPNDVTAALYLLMWTQEIVSSHFICPTTLKMRWDFGGGANTALNWTNWPGVEGVREHVSYSYQNPYPSEAAVAAGFKMNNTLPKEFVLAGDMNPGTDALLRLNVRSAAAEMRTGNSPNHDRDGQNLLYGDLHVEFQTHPFAGVRRNNVYTFGPSGSDQPDKGGEGISGSPAGPNDSILLPTAREIGLADEQGNMIETIPLQQLTDQQRAELCELIMGRYVRNDKEKRLQLEISENSVVITADSKATTFTYELVGTVGESCRLRLAGSGITAQPAEFTLNEGVLWMRGNGTISGYWMRQP